jgi:hypothetical protein
MEIDMVTESEKRKLRAAYGEHIDGRAALAKCAAGLLIIIGLAAIGVATPGDETTHTAALSAPRAEIGR